MSASAPGLQLTTTAPSPAGLAERPRGAAGAGVSGGAAPTVTVIAVDATWPTASRASARIVWVPFATPTVDHAYSKGAAASTDSVRPSRRNVTLVTPTSSDAVAARRTLWLTVAPSVGETRSE